LTPLAACDPDGSRVGLTSSGSETSGSLAATTGKLVLLANGTELAMPVALRLPPVDECAETAPQTCNPEIGDAAAVFNASESARLFDLIASLWRKETVEFETVVYELNGEARRILHGRSLITQLRFGTSITVRWLPQDVKDPGGPRAFRGVPREATKLVVTYPLLKDVPILRASMPVIRPQIVESSDPNTRLPLRHYANIDIDDLKIEIGAAGFGSAVALAKSVIADGEVEDSEFSDVGVVVVGEQGFIAQIQLSAAPVCVRLSELGETATISLVVRSVTIKSSGQSATFGPTTFTLKPCRG
jgi:hypothetical protein